MAIRKGWISGDRFPTHVAKGELEEAIGDRDATLVERATLTTHDLLSNPDVRVKVEGVKAVVAMERQNQADELAQNKKEPGRRKRYESADQHLPAVERPRINGLDEWHKRQR